MSCEAPAPNVNATFVRSKTQTLATGLYRLEQATKSYTRNGQGAFISGSRSRWIPSHLQQQKRHYNSLPFLLQQGLESLFLCKRDLNLSALGCRHSKTIWLQYFAASPRFHGQSTTGCSKDKCWNSSMTKQLANATVLPAKHVLLLTCTGQCSRVCVCFSPRSSFATGPLPLLIKRSDFVGVHHFSAPICSCFRIMPAQPTQCLFVFN